MHQIWCIFGKNMHFLGAFSVFIGYFFENQACAVGVPIGNWATLLPKSWMVPNCCSYLAMLSAKALYKRLAFNGFIITLERTFALGVPGIIWAKSTMNSFGEWVMIARLEYLPSAISSRYSIDSFDCFPFSFLIKKRGQPFGRPRRLINN